MAPRVALILALIGGAYGMRRVGVPAADDRRGRGTAGTWMAGVTAFVMGAAWFDLISENFIARPVQPFWIMIAAAGVVWAAVAFVVFVGWSSRPAWREVHRYAAALAATLACIVTPYLSIAGWPRIDVIGKVICDAATVIGFVIVGRKVRARTDTRFRPTITSRIADNHLERPERADGLEPYHLCGPAVAYVSGAVAAGKEAYP